MGSEGKEVMGRCVPALLAGNVGNKDFDIQGMKIAYWSRYRMTARL